MIRALIVDDEKMTRNGLVRHIKWEQLGVDEVQTAASSNEALQILDTLHPDLVISDIRMPGMNGVELCQEIRRRQPHCQIIFLTAYSDKEYLKAAIEIGALGYVEKPVVPGEVEDEIIKAVKMIRQLQNMQDKNRLELTLQDSRSVLCQRIALELTTDPLNDMRVRSMKALGMFQKAKEVYRVCLIQSSSPMENMNRLIESLTHMLEESGTQLPEYYLVQKNSVCLVMLIGTDKEEDLKGEQSLLMQILRDEWGFDGIVLSDCGAIADFYRDYGHKTHPDAESASAAAVQSGTDLECGSSYEALVEAVKQGKIDEKAVDVAVKRLLTARFALGEMDEPEKVSWTGIPFSVVASAGHDSLALDMARKSMTLLMNKDNTLPLKRGGLTIAVMGPNANDSVMQWGNYNGMPPHTVTILDGIRKALGSDDRLIYEQGCGWVERAQIQSVFNRCKTADGKPGFTARYWNNVTRDGEPVTTAQVTTPFHFCTSGATVFAPGVNLTDFSATYNSVFTPDQSGEVVFDIYAYGSGRLRINGEEVRGFSNQHGGQKSAYTLQVQAGKTYDVELDFEYFRSDAQLNFDLGFKNEVDVRKSVERVKDADIVVFVGGVSPNLEGEEMGVELPGFRGGDRTDIELPAVQRELIAALHHAGKKVVLVNCSGSPIGLEPETGRCGAILQAWYPGQAGGTAVAEVLFGDYNPAGRLPVTFYRNVSQLPDFEDYNMTGRTYRYMTQEPLFPFGHGLSYTSFSYGAVVLGSDNIKSGEKLRLSVPVTNTGKCDGEEVVQVYLKKNDDVEGPSKALRAFKRVHIPAGKTVDVEFDLGDKELVWWNPQSNAMCVSEGSYELMVGGSSQTADLLRRSFVIQP